MFDFIAVTSLALITLLVTSASRMRTGSGSGISFDFRRMSLDIGGESSQWWGPMAVAVIFGLGFATLLTLIVVPVLCSLVDSVKTRRQRA